MEKKIRLKSGTPVGFWALADYFRNGTGGVWSGSRIEFHRSWIVLGGGRRWDMEARIGIDISGEIEANVLVLEREPRRSLKKIPRIVPSLFYFMRSVERRMQRIGYKGRFRTDFLGCSFSANFYKHLKHMTDVARESKRLTKLNMGQTKIAKDNVSKQGKERQK